MITGTRERICSFFCLILKILIEQDAWITFLDLNDERELHVDHVNLAVVFL